VKITYGYTIVNPTVVVKAVYDPPTWIDHIRALWDEVVFPALLFATSVTCFAWGFGLIR
jgi:hypothetical protein